MVCPPSLHSARTQQCYFTGEETEVQIREGTCLSSHSLKHWQAAWFGQYTTFNPSTREAEASLEVGDQPALQSKCQASQDPVSKKQDKNKQNTPSPETLNQNLEYNNPFCPSQASVVPEFITNIY